VEFDNTIIHHSRIARGNHVLETTTLLPRPVDEVFEFFSDAGNLERITPPELAFQILTPTPIGIKENAIIDYRLRLFGIPFRWRTRIAIWEPVSQFVDEQIRGPYRIWKHQHTFEAEGERTRMTDRVEYGLPLQPAGELAMPLVRWQLERIFRYRADAIQQILAT